MSKFDYAFLVGWHTPLGSRNTVEKELIMLKITPCFDHGTAWDGEDEAGVRFLYEISGSSKNAVVRLGRIFVQIWQPEYAPKLGTPKSDELGNWRLTAERVSTQDVAIADDAELVRLITLQRNVGSYRLGDDDELVHTSVEPSEAILNSKKPVEEWEIEELLSNINFGKSRYRFPRIRHVKDEDLETPTLVQEEPNVVSGYYIELEFYSADCFSAGPFQSSAEALVWLYEDYGRTPYEYDPSIWAPVLPPNV